MALDPKHQVVRLLPGERLHADVQPVARRIRARVSLSLLEQPDDVGAAVAGLLGGNAERLHEVFRRVGERGVHRHVEPLDEALRRALVPGTRQDDGGLAVGHERLDLGRRRHRIEEQQALAVVDRVGRDVLIPGLGRTPIRMRRLPVPYAGSQLGHAAIVEE
jgi:hypothetical protein